LSLLTEEDGAAEAALEDIGALLGTSVPRLAPHEMTPEDWAGAGLLILAGGDADGWARALAPGDASSHVLESLDEGGLLYAVGGAAEALGQWVFPEGEAPRRALGWLPGGVILTGRSDPAEMSGLPEHLAREDRSYAIGLGEGAALALGPGGEVEVWGEARPTIALGRGWRST
jgi:hypothetical protein